MQNQKSHCISPPFQETKFGIQGTQYAKSTSLEDK